MAASAIPAATENRFATNRLVTAWLLRRASCVKASRRVDEQGDRAVPFQRPRTIRPTAGLGWSRGRGPAPQRGIVRHPHPRVRLNSSSLKRRGRREVVGGQAAGVGHPDRLSTDVRRDALSNAALGRAGIGASRICWARRRTPFGYERAHPGRPASFSLRHPAIRRSRPGPGGQRRRFGVMAVTDLTEARGAFVDARGRRRSGGGQENTVGRITGHGGARRGR